MMSQADAEATEDEAKSCTNQAQLTAKHVTPLLPETVSADAELIERVIATATRLAAALDVELFEGHGDAEPATADRQHRALLSLQAWRLLLASYRFIKAYDLQIEEAVERLLQHHQLVSQLLPPRHMLSHTEFQSPLREHLAPLLKAYPCRWVGFDNQGRPVYYEHMGGLDMQTWMECTARRDLLRFKFLQAEIGLNKMYQQTLRTNTSVTQQVVIADLDGLGVSHLWGPGIRAFNAIATLLERHYPETIAKIFVVRAPAVFPALFKAVKPFLAEETRKKVFVIGREDTYNVLSEHMDESVIYDFLGGALPAGDLGSDSPRDSPPLLQTLMSMPTKQDTVISAGTVLTALVRASKGQRVHWLFATERRGLDFGLFFKPLAANEDHDLEESSVIFRTDQTKPGPAWRSLLPVETVECDCNPDRGFWDAEDSGEFVLWFDNSSSIFSSKHLHAAVWLS